MHRHKRRYSEEELVVIRSDTGVRPYAQIARQLGRTEKAVRRKGNRLGLYPELIAIRSDGLSRTDVCEYLGVGRKNVQYWQDQGFLKARRITVSGRLPYTFDYDEIKRFMYQRGGLLTMRPVEGWREIYEDARAQLLARYIARPTLCCLLHMSLGGIRRWGRDRGFPAPAPFGGSQNQRYYERAAVRAWLLQHPDYYTAAAREVL